VVRRAGSDLEVHNRRAPPRLNQGVADSRLDSLSPTQGGERRSKRLVGYAQVSLAPGGSAIVHLKIDPAAANHPLSSFDEATHAWLTAPGTYRVFVGTSERDTPLSGTFTVG